MNQNITADESLEALRNDRRELYEMFNPQLVRIEELTAPAGSMYLAKITLMAPCYIVTSENDTEPKRVESNWFYLDVLDGYPDTKPKVYFEPHRRNAGMNTFVSGSECIDMWRKHSSIGNAVEKTLRDMIHDPDVSNEKSPACSALIAWQKDLTARGILPTIKPPSRLVDRSAVTAPMIPSTTRISPPPLPGFSAPSRTIERVQPVPKRIGPPPLPRMG